MSTKIYQFYPSSSYRSECTALQNDFKQLKNQPLNHELRSKIFFHLKICADAKHQEIPGLGDGRCFEKVEKVIKGKLFSSHPGPQNRLSPLANAYIRQFSELQESSIHFDEDEKAFEEGLDQFFVAHQQFVKAYCAEIKEVYKNEPSVVKITQASDIHQFVTPFLEALGRCTIDQIDQFLEKIVSCDPELVFLFSYLAIEKSFLTEGNNLPKVFDSCKEKIIAHCDEYSRLAGEEQDLIHSMLMGSNLVPTAAVKKEVDHIKKWAIESQRNEKCSALYAALMSNSFAFVERTLRLAKQMKIVVASLPEDTCIRPSDAHLFMLYCAISSEERSSAQFEFFQHKAILTMADRYLRLKANERTSISKAVAGLETLAARSPENELFLDIKFYANKLAFADEATIMLKIFNLFR